MTLNDRPRSFKVGYHSNSRASCCLFHGGTNAPMFVYEHKVPMHYTVMQSATLGFSEMANSLIVCIVWGLL